MALTDVTILAISGSLRARSANTEVLRACALLAPPSVAVTPFADLASLPFFNPDLDQQGMEPPSAVGGFRRRVGAADALLISSPEYAHGVPGVLKNALDWLVSGPEMVYKPIALINASPRSTHATQSLAEILRTMSATLVPPAAVALPVSGRDLDAEAIAADAELAPSLRDALAELVVAISACRERRRLFAGTSGGA